MAVRKLFVSHSSKSPEDLERLRVVCDGLKALRYHLLVDMNAEFGNQDAILPGRDWNRRINEWMFECHAAVVLFNRCALERSDWVRKEASVLTWRRDLEKDFCLIPVLLDGICAEALGEGVYGVMRMADSQCIAAPDDPKVMVKSIAAGLGSADLTRPTPFDRLARSLRKIFEEQADTETLEDAWEALDGEDKPDPRVPFAERLVRLLLRNNQLALEHLQELINRIRPRISADRARELVQSLECLWVDPRAASELANAGDEHRLVALNGNYLPLFTAAHYVKRAWFLNDRSQLITVDQQASRTIDGIRECIRAYFYPDCGLTIPDFEKQLARKLRGHKEPVVVLIILDCHSPGQPQFPDTRLCQQIQAQFPNLIFLFGIGPTAPAPKALPKDFRLLNPTLDTDLESDIQFALSDMKRLLAKLYQT